MREISWWSSVCFVGELLYGIALLSNSLMIQQEKKKWISSFVRIAMYTCCFEEVFCTADKYMRGQIRVDYHVTEV